MIKQLDINEKQSTSYCISEALRNEQILINVKKVKGRFKSTPTELKSEPIAIVAFAPSLNDTWKKIKKFKYVMTCSGAHKFLIDKGIIPQYHVDLDPRPHKIKMLGEPQKQTEYLIASTIHPLYLDALDGFDIKLWHIFANESEGLQVLPRGEDLITGGSSVGLRCLTLARLMGFTDFHIFGMDGSYDKRGTHTTEHPNSPQEKFEVEYEGKKYLTTPSMLHVAKETWNELNQLADCKATFYGTGLIQAMSKNYKPEPKHGTLVSFNKPELISQEYIELNKKLHQDNPSYGMGGAKHKDTILKMITPEIKSVLDYGAGKMQLQKSLDFPIFQYDPAIPEISAPPPPADLVVCTDCLEHIEPDKLMFVLDDLRRCVKQVGYFVISTRQAVKTYSNGQNTHLIVQGKDWWNKKLSKYFEVATIQEKQELAELHIIVAPKKVVMPDITSVKYEDKQIKFLTPNDTTKWRAQTLLTKEPSTIEWINSMKEGDVMFDVGANVGSYTVYAGTKGIKVYAFEPEAENFALLVKNMMLNNIEPRAYCLALTDEETAGVLDNGRQEVGGASHTFNESPERFSQGCFGIPLDRLVEKGLPTPHHIKIDVDGLEYKVINGAEKVLQNGLQSLLVEVNPNIPQHQEMVRRLQELGFTYDEAQVERATRKEGTFKGCAEYVFWKIGTHASDYECSIGDYVADKVDESKLNTKPFPYIYVENVFPEDTYKYLVENMPNDYVEIEKSRGTRGYPKRFTASIKNGFWFDLKNTLFEGRIKKAICEKLGVENYESLKEDLLLIRDKEGYQISPHTDTPRKVISALFYLPKEEHKNAGTSLYTPNKKGFTCKTGKHYDFKDFKKVKSMRYKPNSMFAFLRTDNSFHGVEASDTVRDVLLYNILRK